MEEMRWVARETAGYTAVDWLLGRSGRGSVNYSHTLSPRRVSYANTFNSLWRAGLCACPDTFPDCAICRFLYTGCVQCSVMTKPSTRICSVLFFSRKTIPSSRQEIGMNFSRNWQRGLGYVVYITFSWQASPFSLGSYLRMIKEASRFELHDVEPEQQLTMENKNGCMENPVSREPCRMHNQLLFRPSASV